MYLVPGSVGYYIFHWLVVATCLFLTSRIVPGFRLKGFGSALMAALILGLANLLLKPTLLFLTFPINLVTLGLFTFVVNALLLRLCAMVLRDFAIDGWLSAIFGAVIFALLQTGFYWLLR